MTSYRFAAYLGADPTTSGRKLTGLGTLPPHLHSRGPSGFAEGVDSRLTRPVNRVVGSNGDIRTHLHAVVPQSKTRRSTHMRAGGSVAEPRLRSVGRSARGAGQVSGDDDGGGRFRETGQRLAAAVRRLSASGHEMSSAARSSPRFVQSKMAIRGIGLCRLAFVVESRSGSVDCAVEPFGEELPFGVAQHVEARCNRAQDDRCRDVLTFGECGCVTNDAA